MDIFRRNGGHWLRGEEVHEEYAYSPEDLEAYLRQAGFHDIKQYGDRTMRRPKPGAGRIFFVARKDL